MSFKNNKVWAAVLEGGDLAVDQGKVEIRYSLDQEYVYRVKPESLGPESLALSKKIVPDRAKKQEGPRSFLPRKEESPHPLIPMPPQGVIQIYTDGASSGNPGPAGLGVVLLYGDHKREISESIGRATNNVAELNAIKRGLELLKRTDLPIEIHTDSTYCIGVLVKGWKPAMNQELILGIRKLMGRFKQLRLVKVKGHSGVQGNERADALATAGVKKFSG
ncbi:RnhA1 [Desulforapulum autotrophicum HRM2]|uniref:ribonuclease H n=2 Tax=Desulforapulum autotrophicum TaxID=2296 RepID=C0QFZ9_DESAH|nr:RnhA1 [Desulforapulum autotrophicum HRM2]